MSLINFLNPKLKPVVECDAVCEDGYSASNLIADDDEQLSRGFMAFSVTKPPVDIVFEFPKCIDLKVIKLWNSHGALRSTAFEVYGKSEGIWERVANIRDLSKDVEVVTFCYQSDYNSRNSEQQHGEKVFFFRTAHKLLSNTNCIKLIIRATHKSPPVLRRIQIWGLPARSLDKADRELIKSIWHDITHFPTSHHPIIHEPGQSDLTRGQEDQRSPSRCAPELNKDSNLQVPEDFLDAITWELMIFPTVLPSGKVVDQSTIDRHSEEEAKWGRLPSDPFTGLEFTSHRKAVLNVALKARIEKFLAENSEHFKTVPRSLGSSRVRRSRNRHVSQIANLFQVHSSGTGGAGGGCGGTLSSLLSHKKTATATLASSENSSNQPLHPAAKRQRLNEVGYQVSSHTMLTLQSLRGSEIPQKLLNMMTSTATQTSATQTTASFTNATKIGDQDDGGALAACNSYPKNIDRVLQQALHQITRFTQISSRGEEEESGSGRPTTEDYGQESAGDLEEVCIKCQTTDYFYKIRSCGHLVCRRCLIALTQQERCVCNVDLKTGDVERFHKL